MNIDLSPEALVDYRHAYEPTRTEPDRSVILALIDALEEARKRIADLVDANAGMEKERDQAREALDDIRRDHDDEWVPGRIDQLNESPQ